MNKVRYTITGLQNSRVKTQLKNSLQKIDGVNMVNIDAGRNSVEIGYNQRTDETSIKSCIENVGCHIK